MQIRQKLELRKLLAPELRQSLKILALPLLDLKNILDDELLNNPLLEEVSLDTINKTTAENIENLVDSLLHLSSDAERPESSVESGAPDKKKDFLQNAVAAKVSLHDALLRQLGMFSLDDEELFIGHEIIGNIDDNGYLKADLAEIAAVLKLPLEKVDRALALIQQFEPAGVCARNVEECLLIQARLKHAGDLVLEKIIMQHLDDVAKKNYKKISRSLPVPLEQVRSAVQKISLLDPKPGRNFSVDGIQQVIPDITIYENENEELTVIINNEVVPRVIISRTYIEMLKQENLDAVTKEFLVSKLRRARELLRAVSKRRSTLRRVVDQVVAVQHEALKQGMEYLKPLTFKEVSLKIAMHETTVCRVVMNKYVQTHYGIVALKDFFPSRIRGGSVETGDAVSSEKIKGLIVECISEEDKRHPVSDQDIVKLILEREKLKVARRTVSKYREELKILSSPFRRER